MTPTRLREIASQLVNNCSAYQETVMKVGAYRPCRTCTAMAEELREYGKELKNQQDKRGPYVVAST